MNKFFKCAVVSIVLSILLAKVGPANICVGEQRKVVPAAFNNNAWVTYWDYDDGIKEFKKIKSQLNSVSYFAYSFESDGKLVPPAQASHAANLPKNGKILRYLTVVNDVKTTGGKNLLKNRDVLNLVLADEASTQIHINELLKTVNTQKFDGLEIDYEGLWKDQLLVRRYQRFLEMLVAAAGEKNILLRVILEPSVDFQKVILPKGPEYVVMCYNLYGTHSKSGGPKADTVFLERTINRMSFLPRPASVALATGGCVWKQGQKSYFVNEKEALALQKELKAEAKRDTVSQAMYFSGTDAKGKSVECWYADGQTIGYWKRVALDKGVDGISLWRLGSNENIKKYYAGVMK